LIQPWFEKTRIWLNLIRVICDPGGNFCDHREHKGHKETRSHLNINHG